MRITDISLTSCAYADRSPIHYLNCEPKHIKNMPNHRSPPGNNVHHVQSENDLCNLNPDSPASYTGRAQKRIRIDGQEQSGYEVLKDELSAMLTTMLSSWKKEQDIMLNKMLNDLTELKSQNSSIKSTNDALEKSLQFMSSQYEEIKQKLVDMEGERKENMNYISTLENNINELQKRAKFTVIEFKNLTSPREQIRSESQQDLCELVKKTCNAVKTQIQISDIKDIYRIKTKTGVSTVVTELSSVLTRNRILNGVKEFNKLNPGNKLSSSTIGHSGPKIPIYVAESLTSKDRKLYAMTREKAKFLEYKYCWINNGRIFMKRVDGDTRIQIKNEADLETLKKIT